MSATTIALLNDLARVTLTHCRVVITAGIAALNDLDTLMAKVQAFNDFLVFGMMAVGSFSSGQLLANYGWSAVNLVVFPSVLLGLAALTLASWARRRASSQALSELPEPGI